VCRQSRSLQSTGSRCQAAQVSAISRIMRLPNDRTNGLVQLNSACLSPVSDEYLAWSAKDSQSYIRPPIIGRAPAPPEAMFEVCSTGPAGKVGCSAVSFVRTLEPPQGEPHDFRTISGAH
jgi:hypothetical protein